jgi:ubiquinone/menaquinone biosynthesis C-methylase UbiE
MNILKECIMALNWIDAEKFSINTLLLMDRWVLRFLLGLYEYDLTGWYSNNEYRYHFGIILANNQVIQWYFMEKCPEGKERVNELIKNVPQNLPQNEIRKSEMYILDKIDSFVVYVYPEIMENLNYIKYWTPDKLLSIIDFSDKIILDIGSGTGRLAFAAANTAKYIYAIEPVDRLREYLRDKKNKLGIKNIRISDGRIEEIPYPDNIFDIVMSGHVMGDNYDQEMTEMVRVVKNGGYIITCIGEDNDNAIRTEPNKEMIRLGFEPIYYKSVLGANIYNYRKKIMK